MSATKKNSEKGYELSQAKIDQIRAAVRDGHPHFSTQPEHRTSPHNVGMYGWSIEALFTLGDGKRHSYADFKAALREIASNKNTIQVGEKDEKTTGWQRFIRKGVSPRAETDENAKDVDAKILQNLEVLQRADYGLKLLTYGRRILQSKGAVINIYRGGEAGKELFIELDIDSKTPVNERRVRNVEPAKAVKVKAKAKAKPKAKAKASTKVKAKTPKATPATDSTTSAAETTPASDAVLATTPA